jgi:hypothetical protein
MLQAGARIRSWTMVVAVGVLALAACATDEPNTLAPAVDVPETVALGKFPQPLTSDDTIPPPPTTIVVVDETTPSTAPPEPITGPIGDEVLGNRILLIGDTVIASTAPRFDGEMCAALEAFGWQGEIAAEVGRFVEFGRTVVEARIVPEEPEWDAVAVMLGNHFDGDSAAFRAELDALLADLAPRPVLLYTLVEDDTYQGELNEIIRDLKRFHPNVVILDWAKIAAGDESELIVADTPSGLSEEGRRRLALQTVAALGVPPTTEGVERRRTLTSAAKTGHDGQVADDREPHQQRPGGDLHPDRHAGDAGHRSAARRDEPRQPGERQSGQDEHHEQVVPQRLGDVAPEQMVGRPREAAAGAPPPGQHPERARHEDAPV